MKSVVICGAKPAHVDFIRHLSKEAFEVYGDYENLLPEWFSRGFASTLVAEKDGIPLGYGMLGARRPLMKDYSGELLAIAVRSVYRRFGLGHLIMQSILDVARDYKMRQIVLHTGQDNVSAQHLFKRHGFYVVEIKRQFYEGGQTALMMEKRLD